jgi:saccharopine dehydrogenase-like NADP-dependent oxidoreductase
MMNILVFGAGRSAFLTVEYLVQNAADKGWKVTVADASEANLQLIEKDFPGTETSLSDVHNEEARKKLLSGKDIVVSLLPARFHILVAQDCLELGIHLITPSYLTPDLRAMNEGARKKGLTFIAELGLDPGIDHLSAMRIIDGLKKKGCRIFSFRSWTGGLIGKENEKTRKRENENGNWNYKFSWAPYNVIRAGQDGALFKAHDEIRYVPYHRLFEEIEKIEVAGEKLEGYYNRNSLPYQDYYGLHETTDFIRGTLRYPGFCEKWNRLVQTGITEDKVPLPNDLKNVSFHDFLKIFNAQDDKVLLGLTEPEKAWNFAGMTGAEALQKVLEKEWEMKQDGKDRVVMLHEFGYEEQGKKWLLKSWFDLEGEDKERTAMALTVGLPLALGAELIAEGKIKTHGVLLPVIPEIYEPLLERLKGFGVLFKEEVSEV